MWKIRETCSVPANYTRGKCIHLQPLSDHLEELELRMANLRVIRENGSFVDRSYSKVVMSKVRSGSRWVTTWEGK